MAKKIKKVAFIESLKRNNEKIRDDRASAIVEDAKLFYARGIEDIELQIKKIEREQENALDLSFTTADSLVLASDFKADACVRQDIELGVQRFNLDLTLGIAKERYAFLFGN